jgi:hypothetical protein
MSTQEIPRDKWAPFLNGFSQQHEGWLVTLEVFSPDIGAQQQAKELPLEGITIASGEDEPETIAISVGRNPADHITHTVDSPAHIWLQRTSAGANAALEIESEDATRTLLRFRSAWPAEMVDGVILQ